MQYRSSDLRLQCRRPTFSVVIPCWNAAATIEKTLHSVLNQTFGDLEVIVVDDGSTDGTADILERCFRVEPRVRVITQTKGGPSRARNHAVLEVARGQYIAFMDADDLWAPEKLERSAAALDADAGLAGIYGRTAFFRDDAQAARTVSTVLDHPLTPRDLLRGNAVCTMSNLVVRADAFRASGGFDPSIVYSEDLEWLVRFTAAGHRVEAIDETLVYYRSSDAGLSFNVDRMHQGWKSAVESAIRSGCDLDRRSVRAAEAVHLRLLSRRALRGSAPRCTALRLAIRGALCSPVGFFSDPGRALLTLCAALVEPLLPSNLRRLAMQF